MHRFLAQLLFAVSDPCWALQVLHGTGSWPGLRGCGAAVSQAGWLLRMLGQVPASLWDFGRVVNIHRHLGTIKSAVFAAPGRSAPAPPACSCGSRVGGSQSFQSTEGSPLPQFSVPFMLFGNLGGDRISTASCLRF